VARRIAAGDRAALKGLVRVGWQADTEVTLPGAGHLVHQVYASALPIAYAHDPVADWEPFARLVLEAAYEATLAIAAMTPSRRVFLTRLGGGAFGNPPGWITDAIAGALTRFAAADLDVRLVSYGRPDPANRPLLAVT
jgi:O-acetyl-ADP-ribose deacetylase (regulator of RNase III)